MLRSIFVAVSGLRNHQTKMDIIGHNIANVNTPGYKRSRVTFQEALNQTLQGASRPDGGKGGTNPMQVGLGMNLGSIDTFHTQSGLQGTGRMTDLAIEGLGYFVLQGVGDNFLYTRVGAFGWDSAGYLVNGTGRRVQGYRYDPQAGEWSKKIDHMQLLPRDQLAPPQQTGEITFAGNLAFDADIGDTYTRSVTVYDELGTSRNITFAFERGATDWTWTATWDSGSEHGNIAFNSDGSFASGDMVLDLGGGWSINLNLAGITQYAGNGVSYLELEQNGFAQGTLVEVTFDTSGVLSGVYSNGVSRPLLRVALASFANPEGLNNVGNTLFSESNNSGRAQMGLAGQGALGTISPSSLEISNVDLAQEFTDMIITQRGFQANSRIITASDEMLQELVNLKR
ncbi:MAG: flagellar hook protein FlgE [bacterium]|jgi:flagellar hook protein FlgE